MKLFWAVVFGMQLVAVLLIMRLAVDLLLRVLGGLG